ncbi:ABC transporter permease [Brevibacillus choshinensis]|uniref:ABC transporter permease n=2 Tax=Brevibacillus choshinensis TaxID=54911 RepID=UPI002E1E8653|nr:ABC transporter permease [Brevibacillus choshinensis]MED4780986.1 ABC transporter permease [Brevibacillus choshinensis]
MLLNRNTAATEDLRTQTFLHRLSDYWIFGVLVLLILVFSIINPVFMSITNWINTSTFMTDTLLLALGQTVVILTAGIDLSVGAAMGLSSMVFALILEYGMNIGLSQWVSIPLGIVGGMATGLTIGLVNGLLITRWNITPFIATLGMLGVCTGLTFIISNGTSVTTLPEDIGVIGNHIFLGFISFSVLVAGLGVVWIYMLLGKTRFGRYTYAIGSNVESARRAGINVSAHLTKVYMLSGFLASLAGIIIVMRFVNGSPLTGSHTELNAIAAVVIGGTSLFGGRGSISGTVVGAAIISVLLTGLVLGHVQPYWQIVAIGAIIILAVYIDQFRNRHKKS